MNLRERMLGYSDATPEELAYLASARWHILREKVKWTLAYLFTLSLIFGFVAGITLFASPDDVRNTHDMFIVKAVFLGIFLLLMIVSYWITTLFIQRCHPTADMSWLLKTISRSRAPKDIIDEFRQKETIQKC